MLELFGANTGNSCRAAIALYEAERPFVPRLLQHNHTGSQRTRRRARYSQQ
jgi:hypothetical protein